MTNKDLLQYKKICFCIVKYEEDLKRLEIKTSGASAANLTGMPRSNSNVSSVETAVLKKEALEERIAALKRAKCDIETFIKNIKDPLLYIWAKGRYIEGLSWIRISHKYGHGVSENTIAQTLLRYIKRSNTL